MTPVVIGFCVRLFFPVLLLFSVTLTLIRAQPYEDDTLQELLLPDGCPAPCFMGIRPGVTSADLAALVLRSHRWIEQVEASEFAIVWQWNGQQPSFLYNTVSVRAGSFGGVILLSEQTVRSIRLSSRISLGDLHLTLGRPNSIDSLSISFGDYIKLIVPYPEYALTVEISIQCPVDGGNYWLGTGYIEWSVQRRSFATTASTHLRELLPMFRRYNC